MLAYAAKRVMATIPVMAIVAFLVFSLLYIAPGDPAAIIAGDQATPADVDRIRESLGLDRPFIVRFVEWAWRVVSGDLGQSIFTNLPVTHMIAQRIEPTVSLMVLTLILTIVVAVPMGVAAAANQGTWIDRVVMLVSVSTSWRMSSRCNSICSRCRATRPSPPASGPGCPTSSSRSSPCRPPSWR